MFLDFYLRNLSQILGKQFIKLTGWGLLDLYLGNFNLSSEDAILLINLRVVP